MVASIYSGVTFPNRGDKRKYHLDPRPGGKAIGSRNRGGRGGKTVNKDGGTLQPLSRDDQEYVEEHHTARMQGLTIGTEKAETELAREKEGLRGDTAQANRDETLSKIEEIQMEAKRREEDFAQEIHGAKTQTEKAKLFATKQKNQNEGLVQLYEMAKLTSNDEGISQMGGKFYSEYMRSMGEPEPNGVVHFYTGQDKDGNEVQKMGIARQSLKMETDDQGGRHIAAGDLEPVMINGKPVEFNVEALEGALQGKNAQKQQITAMENDVNLIAEKMKPRKGENENDVWFRALREHQTKNRKPISDVYQEADLLIQKRHMRESESYSPERLRKRRAAAEVELAYQMKKWYGNDWREQLKLDRQVIQGKGLDNQGKVITEGDPNANQYNDNNDPLGKHH